MRREIPPLLSEPCNNGASADLGMSASGSVSEHDLKGQGQTALNPSYPASAQVLP
jgi:hypothetical protein